MLWVDVVVTVVVVVEEVEMPVDFGGTTTVWKRLLLLLLLLGRKEEVPVEMGMILSKRSVPVVGSRLDLTIRQTCPLTFDITL